jgi:hypothetical protein
MLEANDELPVASTSLLPVIKFTCFLTKDYGYVGLADSEVEQGDSVCGLLGVKVPLILRKQNDVWIRVGQWQVYVKRLLDDPWLTMFSLLPNMMDGEVMDGLGEGNYNLQEFVLE